MENSITVFISVNLFITTTYSKYNFLNDDYHKPDRINTNVMNTEGNKYKPEGRLLANS